MKNTEIIQQDNKKAAKAAKKAARKAAQIIYMRADDGNVVGLKAVAQGGSYAIAITASKAAPEAAQAFTREEVLAMLEEFARTAIIRELDPAKLGVVAASYLNAKLSHSKTEVAK